METLLSEEAVNVAWRWGEFELRPARRQLLRAGELVEVEDRVFELLQLLLRHRERALDRQEVIAAIWGKRPVSDATLRQLVYRTRRAIGDDGEHQATISTHYGRSVQWVAPVELVRDPVAVDAPVDAAPAPMDDAPPSVPERRTLPDRRSDSIPTVAPVATPRRRSPRHWAWIAAALLVLVGGGITAWLLQGRLYGNGGSPADAGASRAAANAPPATIAVLPLVDLDANQDESYVSDGMTEELINRLARMPNLRVTARTSAFVFRGKPDDVRDVARRLGVANVLEGSMQRSGDHWRVRVALVDARGDYELWANEYDASAGDLLAMEDHIAANVVKALYPKLEATSYAATAPRPPVDAAAHDAYLVGLEYLRRRDVDDINRAIAYFQRAIQAEPTYADAWIGLASGYAVLRDYDADALPDTHYDDALAAVNKALSLDPDAPHAHAVLGLLRMRHWQWASAAAEFQRALALDPNDATAHQWFGIYFWFTGNMPAALKQMRAARELDPLSPIINVDLSRAMTYAGDAKGGLAQARAAVELAPKFELTHLFLASALGGQGQFAEGIKEINSGMALRPPPPASDDLTFLGGMEWAAGDHDGARKLLAEVEARAKLHYVSGVALASLEWRVGEKDQAFANLDRAAADHDGLLMTVSGSRNDEWCADPRFPQLLAKMNLPLR